MSGRSTPDPAESLAAPGNRGGWEGSDVVQDDLDWLLKTRRITAEAICRLPGSELEPVLESGERVVFLAHFQRGFGLPASPFFRDFLNYFGLQPHHLLANAITSLSAFTSFMEGVPRPLAYCCRLGQVFPPPEENHPKQGRDREGDDHMRSG